LGAIIFFVVETIFGGAGVWYLIGLGASALAFSLFLPRGLWGVLQERFGLRLMPIGYRLLFLDGSQTDRKPTTIRSPSDAT
jgi:branched-chain amino acid transport system permease protein